MNIVEAKAKAVEKFGAAVRVAITGARDEHVILCIEYSRGSMTVIGRGATWDQAFKDAEDRAVTGKRSENERMLRAIADAVRRDDEAHGLRERKSWLQRLLGL